MTFAPKRAKTLRASWWWAPEDGPVEIPHQDITLRVAQYAYGDPFVVLEGLSDNEGECLRFNLFDLLDALGLVSGLVSMRGSRPVLVKRP